MTSPGTQLILGATGSIGAALARVLHARGDHVVLAGRNADKLKALADELKKQVRTVIGPVATPDEIRFTDALPKTRSGKIMRRLLKQVAAGQLVTGDTTTLEDLSVLAKLATAED